VPDPIPPASLRRLPQYLRLLRTWEAEGRATISCTPIAEHFDQDPTQVRKDLALVGVGGRPKVGYDLAELADGIERFLGWDNATDAFLVGAGNLGSALLGYRGFATSGLTILAAFDVDPAKAGLRIAGRPVYPLSKLANLVERMHVRLGVLCVPENSAETAARAMVDAGLCAIWNFTPVRLDLGEAVIVEDVDLSQSLAVLSHRLRQRGGRAKRPAVAERQHPFPG
jgi:redox-sensing transcriptional repressor